MRLSYVILSVLCGLTLVCGQYLDATIPLPDTFTGIAHPHCIVYDPTTNRVFVGGESDRFGNCIIAIDARTGAKLARISTPETWALSCDSVNNRLYAAHYHDNLCSILDATTGELLASVPVGAGPAAICGNPFNNRAYVLASNSNEVTIIDGATNQVRATLSFVGNLSDICYDAANNCVYVANRLDPNVIVIDGAGDSIVGRVRTLQRRSALLSVSSLNRIYCVNPEAGTITVIDGQTNGVSANITLDHGLGKMCYNPQNHKLYCTNETLNYVGVVDVATNQVLARVPVRSTPGGLFYNPADNRVYCTDSGNAAHPDSAITVIDGAGDSVVATRAAGRSPGALCGNRTGDRVFSADVNGASASMIDCTSGQRTRIPVAPTWIGALGFDDRNDRLYCSNAQDEITIFDGSTHAVIRTVRVGEAVERFVYNSAGNKMYALAKDLFVFDGAGETLVARIPVGTLNDLLCVPAHNKLYGAALYDGSIVVVDGAGDSVLSTIPVGQEPGSLVYDSLDDKVYCGGGGPPDLVAIDPARDSVVAGIELHAGCQQVCYSATADKLCYFDDGGGTEVIDCRRDSSIAFIDSGFEYPPEPCYDRTDNRVYFVDWANRLFAFDCAGDTTSAQVQLSWEPSALFHSTRTDRLYVFDAPESWLTVFDAHNEAVLTTIYLGAEADQAVANPDGSQIFAANYYRPMVWVLRDSALAVGERPPHQTRGEIAMPSIVRRTLLVPLALAPDPKSPVALLDVTGRKVLDLRAGPNDVRRLSPGVYFAASAATRSTRKIMIVN